MSYLLIPKTSLDFTKAVISLWFRVPQASIDNIIAAPSGPFMANNTVIPLVTLGPPAEQEVYSPVFQKYGQVPAYNPTTGTFVIAAPIGAFIPTDEGTILTDPSYIGLQCINQDGVVSLSIVVNLQTHTRATLTDFTLIATGATDENPDPGGNGGLLWKPSGYTDMSFSNTGTPESYNILVSIADATSFADKWHHLLISCDLTNSISTIATAGTIADGVISYNRLWVALDDVNYTGFDAFPNWPGPPLDVNATITNTTFNVAAAPTPSVEDISLAGIAVPDSFKLGGFLDPSSSLQLLSTGGVITPTASLPAVPIPVNEVGIPASKEFVNNIYRCEMAEFQMFTGVSMDTGVTANRRAFIAPNKKGQLAPVTSIAPGLPRDPLAGTDPVALINPSAPIKLLGKKPVVALVNRSSNWITGLDTGTAAKGAPPMSSAGKIIPYFPSPRLGV